MTNHSLKTALAACVLIMHLGCDSILTQPVWRGCPNGPLCELDMDVNASAGDATVNAREDMDVITTTDAQILPDMGVQPIVPCPDINQILETETGINWICIKGGVFSMGRNDGPDTQGPRHIVRIPTFWISQSEITVAQFRKCVRDDELSCTPPSASGESSNFYADSDRERHPINGLNIEAIEEYLRYVGDGARLPTESEWEFVASSRGNQSPYPWGSELKGCDATQVNLAGDDTMCGYLGTESVCSNEDRSLESVCDMMGNVSEWVQDDYHGRYDCRDSVNVTGCSVGSLEQAPEDGTAWVAARASAGRVVRGGSYRYGETDTPTHRVSIWARRVKEPTAQQDDIGFRVVRTTMPAQ